ncbi:MAG TPA: DUF87 domain-containing protein [Patescibacteria group bacterium]
MTINIFGWRLNIFKSIPKWEWIIGVLVLSGAALYALFRNRLSLFHAFETVKLKKYNIDHSFQDTLYFEVTIPKDSQTTAFHVQQKILKALHSVYLDPIEEPHAFSRHFFFFQKWYRWWKVHRNLRAFFTFQIWAQYPYISFRLVIPKACFDSIEKAIFNAYSNAEITMLNTTKILSEVAKFQKSYFAYGQTTIEGKFYQQVKTFKDLSADPVDSIISAMAGLEKGRFMVYNVTISPASHYFNQVINYLIEEQDRYAALAEERRKFFPHKTTIVSELAVTVAMAMAEKMRALLFQTVVSYWVISSTPEDAEARLEDIQAVLTEINQKNMNILKHRKLFTRQVEELETSGLLKDLLETKPILRIRSFSFGRSYKNYGQILSDIELYSFWHLPNTTNQTVSSIKMATFKKIPPSHQMREYNENFFIDLGYSNFRMQEETRIGISTWNDMKKHVHILGGPGSGKSEILKNILGNLLQKEDHEKTACIIIDPKNDFAMDLLTMIPEHRKEDVIYFNPPKQKDRPLSFPFFPQFSGEKTNDEKIEFLTSIMKRLVQIDSAWSWGPELENILRQFFATTCILPQQSLSGLDLLLHEPNQIKNLLRYLPTRLQKFWIDSILKRTNNDLAKYLATTNNKLGKFLDYPEFMNIADRLDTKITFEEMIKTGKIFIANLGSSSEQMKKYYSVYLSAHIAEAISGQAMLLNEERKPTVFVIDEFQRVASNIFETLFSEARALNTALIVSNQFMGQLDERIQKSIESNIATRIFMRTAVSDAEIAAKILGEKVRVEDIINLPTGMAYIKTLVEGIPQGVMSIQIQKVSHPTDIVKDTEQYFIKETMERYGTPLEVIKQKRDIVNSIYYSADREQVFHEHMSRHSTFELAQAYSLPENLDSS